LCVLFEIVDHGGRHGDAMRALTQWWHTLASSEAPVVLQLHWVMRPASHRHIRMVVEIIVDLPAFFVASIARSHLTWKGLTSM
jgi:hypothetical protein